MRQNYFTEEIQLRTTRTDSFRCFQLVARKVCGGKVRNPLMDLTVTKTPLSSRAAAGWNAEDVPQIERI